MIIATKGFFFSIHVTFRAEEQLLVHIYHSISLEQLDSTLAWLCMQALFLKVSLPFDINMAVRMNSEVIFQKHFKQNSIGIE